jgi:hypothetical protein
VSLRCLEPREYFKQANLLGKAMPAVRSRYTKALGQFSGSGELEMTPAEMAEIQRPLSLVVPAADLAGM